MDMKRLQRGLALTLAGVALVGGLSACAPLVVGGAMVGGALLVSDRRTSGTQIEDEGIELRAQSRLRAQLGDKGHINITSYNRQALLTGEVPTAQDKELAGQIVAKVENVRTVVNELAVMGNSSIGDRSNDVLISGRTKAALVDAKDLQANAFKVVTERGIVYLMGRVTQREANRATDVVRSTSGVVKLVRVLEIISEQELQQLQPPAPKEDKAGGATYGSTN